MTAGIASYTRLCVGTSVPYNLIFDSREASQTVSLLSIEMLILAGGSHVRYSESKPVDMAYLVAVVYSQVYFSFVTMRMSESVTFFKNDALLG